MQPTSWAEAMDRFVGGVRKVQEAHGAEAFAFLGTGQMPTEELVFLGSLAKFGMGMVHGRGKPLQDTGTGSYRVNPK